MKLLAAIAFVGGVSAVSLTQDELASVKVDVTVNVQDGKDSGVGNGRLAKIAPAQLPTGGCKHFVAVLLGKVSCLETDALIPK